MDGLPLVITWIIFGVVFLLIAISAAIQLARAIYLTTKENASLSNVLWINGLAFIASLSRFILMWIFAFTGLAKIQAKEEVKGLIEPWAGFLLSTLPPVSLTIAFFMILFLLMSFTQGPQIGQMKKGGLLGFLGKMKGAFLIAVVLEVLTLLILVFGAVIIQETAKAKGQSYDKNALVGIVMFATVIFTIVPVVLVILYLTTTRKLVRELNKFADLSEVNKVRIRGLHRRAALFSLALLGMAIVTQLITLPPPESAAFLPVYIIDTIFEVICLAFLLYFHRKFPSKQKFLNSRSKTMSSARAPPIQVDEPPPKDSPFSSKI